MSKEFDGCVEKKKLSKFSPGPNVAKNKLKEAIEDLNAAKEGFKSKKYKWPTIQSYYAMFHTGNALLMKKGYREKNSHYCLIVGVKELYVKEKIIDITFIEALQKGKTLRESANYQDEWSKEACKELIDKAEEFIKIAKKIVKEK